MKPSISKFETPKIKKSAISNPETPKILKTVSNPATPRTPKSVRFADDEVKKIPKFIQVHHFDSDESKSVDNQPVQFNFLPWNFIPIDGIPLSAIFEPAKKTYQEVRFHMSIPMTPKSPDPKDLEIDPNHKPKIIPFN